MVLSNIEIIKVLEHGLVKISPCPQLVDPTQKPYDTSAIDLHLGDELVLIDPNPGLIVDLAAANIPQLLGQQGRRQSLTTAGYVLEPGGFLLAQTHETVDFSIPEVPYAPIYSARVEGKSKFARSGLIIHLTAPTIHANFRGRITLEMANLGPFRLSLKPGMPICQLIIEEVKGQISAKANPTFIGQQSPTGPSGS
jgi:dCTP deaminase